MKWIRNNNSSDSKGKKREKKKKKRKGESKKKGGGQLKSKTSMSNFLNETSWKTEAEKNMGMGSMNRLEKDPRFAL